MSAIARSNGSSMSAVSRRSFRLPIASTQALWIIRKPARAICTVSPAMAMIDAADAARPSTFTVTSPSCSRRRL
jgi:hypothetical protein